MSSRAIPASSTRPRSVDVREAARQLGVRYVLEGSVRKSGRADPDHGAVDRREDGSHLWAERYDRAVDDIFAIQDEITLVLATEMQVRLTEGEQARLGYTTTHNVEAWTYRARGMSYYRLPPTKETGTPRSSGWERRWRSIRLRRRSTPCSLRCMVWTPDSSGSDSFEIALQGPRLRRAALELDPGNATPTSRRASSCSCDGAMTTPSPRQEGGSAGARLGGRGAIRRLHAHSFGISRTGAGAD